MSPFPSKSQHVCCTCRHGVFCVADEQYIGTALSYYLLSEGVDLSKHATGELAVAMATSGGGFDQEEVTEEMLDEIRAGTDSPALLPNLHEHPGECHGHDRWTMLWIPLCMHPLFNWCTS